MLTNFEKIKNATIQELAEYLDRTIGTCEGCPAYDHCCEGFCADCVTTITEWLNMAFCKEEWGE